MNDYNDDKPFSEIETKDILDVLNNAITTRSKVHLWTEGRKYQYISRVSKVVESDANQHKAFTMMVPKDPKFQIALDQNSIEEVFFSIQLPTDLIYGKAIVRKSNEVAFQFKVNIPLYKVQRRRAIRVPVPADMSSPVELVVEGFPLITGTLLNISTGGIGLMVKDLSLEKDFVVGRKAEIKFQFGTLPVVAKVNLRYAIPIQGSLMSKRLKIGIQYDEIPQKTVDEIHIYVMQQSTRYLTQKI